MAKLGYTWYPKDWGNSESVFELTLSERGLYREFIDLAMLNDNKTEIKKNVWTRKFFVSIEELNHILEKLSSLNLIELKDNFLFIQSCEPRLNLVRGGSKGGKNKPNAKPISKPLPSLEEKNDKPDAKQREIESKIKEKETKDNISLSLENDFTIFWNKYDKKNDSKKCKDKFFKLKQSEIDIILNVVDSYVSSTPDLQFRKNPLTWLNGKCWNDVEVNEFLPTKDKPFGKTNQI